MSAKDNFLVSVLTSTHPAAGIGDRGAAGKAAVPRAAAGGSSGAHFLRHISDI